MTTVATSTPEYPLDDWITMVKDCKYLPENDLKKLCDLVRMLSNTKHMYTTNVFSNFVIGEVLPFGRV